MREVITFVNYQFHFYLIPTIISAIILLGLTYYAYKNRSVRGAKALIISMLTGVIWSVGNVLEMAALDLSTKLFWANLQYLAYAFAPVSWLFVVLYFVDKSHWINKKNIIIISIIPILTNILIWTNGWHQLIRQDIYLDISGSISVIAKNYGPWFWVHSFYCYLLNFIYLYLLIKAIFSKNLIYKRQSAFLITGLGLVNLFNLLYIFDLSPVTRYDLTPMLFSISGIIIIWGIFRFKLFELIPIARKTIIEKMTTGIIVIDRSLRIIDMNVVAQRIIGVDKNRAIGKILSNIHPELSELLNLKNELLEISQKEVSLSFDKGIRYYELEVSPIRDHRNELAAWILSINDITELKLARENLYQQQKEVAISNERKWIAHELHDDFSQVLQYIKTQSAVVKKYAERELWEEVSVHINRLYDVANQTNTNIRDSINKLNEEKQDWNFQEELMDYLSKLCGANGFFSIKNDLEDKELIGMSDFTGYQVYRILLEALNNAVKHGSPESIRIELYLKAVKLKMIIRDDGCGFDMSLLSKKVGYGLDTMRERTKACQGKLQIASEPGQGTNVMVEIPAIKGDNQSIVVVLKKGDV